MNINPAAVFDESAVTETETVELSLETALDELLTNETYSPYAVAKIVNAVFEVFGSEKRIPPQMIYTYAKKNMIKNDNKIIQRDDARAWMMKYISKNI